MSFNLLIASYLESHLAEKISEVDHRINVIYRPDLIAPPRFPADHAGSGTFQRSEKQESEWLSLLKTADILFDFDRTHLEDLPSVAPNVKWLQATSSGIGQALHKYNYDVKMPNTTFTSARGVHAQPLAEFCLMVMFAFNKKLLPTLENQKRKRWERFAGTDLKGSTIGIIGLGKIGQEVARLSQCLGMHVLGVKQDIIGINPTDVQVDELYSSNNINEVLSRSEYVVLITPHTPETEKMIGEDEISMLPEGAILINIGRGAIIDEQALIRALQSGHLRGAGLDVFEVEPLPKNSPLWSMSNVIVSPHSGSTSDRENELITDIFCENISRFLKGTPLINVINTKKMF